MSRGLRRHTGRSKGAGGRAGAGCEPSVVAVKRARTRERPELRFQAASDQALRFYLGERIGRRRHERVGCSCWRLRRQEPLAVDPEYPALRIVPPAELRLTAATVDHRKFRQTFPNTNRRRDKNSRRARLACESAGCATGGGVWGPDLEDWAAHRGIPCRRNWSKLPHRRERINAYFLDFLRRGSPLPGRSGGRACGAAIANTRGRKWLREAWESRDGQRRCIRFATPGCLAIDWKDSAGKYFEGPRADGLIAIWGPGGGSGTLTRGSFLATEARMSFAVVESGRDLQHERCRNFGRPRVRPC